MIPPFKEQSFLSKLVLITILSLYLLILAGGIVRSTGSGMGCPDWPKCFGQYIPPTDKDDLPKNYLSTFKEKRLQKNERLSKMMASLGFLNLSNKILNEDFIKEEHSFNAVKTWIEYINRLIGALSGLFVLAVCVVSISKFKRIKGLIVWPFVLLILMLFQAWLGSLVVSTNLLEGMITVHMVFAAIIFMVAIYLFYRLNRRNDNYKQLPDFSIPQSYIIASYALIALILIQITLGSQVRENLDAIARNFEYRSRDSWISNIGLEFLIHRSFSIVILILSLFTLWKSKSNRALKSYTLPVFVIIMISIVTGVAMNYFAIPRWAQPIHLLMGISLIAYQFYLLLVVLEIKRNKNGAIA